MGRFHKALPNVKGAYVTLKYFTPDFQEIYTDISAVSVTLCNSGADTCALNPPCSMCSAKRAAGKHLICRILASKRETGKVEKKLKNYRPGDDGTLRSV